MRHTLLLTLVLPLAACREAAIAPPLASAPAPLAAARPSPLPLPDGLDAPGPTLRLVVLGDGGYSSPVHELAFAAARTVLERSRAAGVPALVLMPGDLTYNVGLPEDCAAARRRLADDYLDPLPGARFVVVGGNHDHGNPGTTEHPEIARRHAYFDCAHTATLAPSLGWDPATCACDPGWEYPGGGADTGTRELVAPAPGRRGFTLVTYDSQAALARPLAVAASLAAALDAVPRDRDIVLMGHHPWRSSGAHARPGSPRPQDLESPPYRAMVAALRPVIAGRRDRLALAVYGHDHHLEFAPGEVVPLVVSGAAAKATPVIIPPPAGGFAAGETAGFAVLDLRSDGGLDLAFVSEQAPARFSLPARARNDTGVSPAPDSVTADRPDRP